MPRRFSWPGAFLHAPRGYGIACPAKREALHAGPDGRQGRDAIQLPRQAEAGHRFDVHPHRLANLQVGDIRLVDVGRDNHVRQIRHNEHLGAAVKTAGT